MVAEAPGIGHHEHHHRRRRDGRYDSGKDDYLFHMFLITSSFFLHRHFGALPISEIFAVEISHKHNLKVVDQDQDMHR